MGQELTARRLIDAANQHARTVQALKGGLALRRPGESVQEAKDRSRFDFGVSCVFLHAVIVELTIKGLLWHETGTEPDYTHDIKGLFGDLKSATQAQIEALYEKCRLPYARASIHANQQWGEEGVHVEVASLQEALQWNERAIRDLKYDLLPHGKSVPTGAMWSANVLWVGSPETMPSFGVKLAEWADGQVPEQEG